MIGQWIGHFKGDNEGFVYLSIEKIDNNYIGLMFARDQNIDNPSFVFFFNNIEEKEQMEAIGTTIGFMHPRRYFFMSIENYEKYYKDQETVPHEIAFRGEHKKNEMKLAWATDSGKKGGAFLNRSDMKKKSRIKTRKFKWKTFKKYISETMDVEKYIFRGQKEKWKLRTTLHRLGRSNLIRYSNIDIPKLRKHIIPHTNFEFDLSNQDHYGALLSLAQHHGYPTPFLDWSESPFVAAYFAFENLKKEDEKEGFVRIFAFNRTEWESSYPQKIRHLKVLVPHLDIISFLPIENRRVIPQQAVTTFSNMDDLEELISVREKETGKKFIDVIELYREERQTVLKDLRYMGITAGSLFPGIDGVCKELRYRYFAE